MKKKIYIYFVLTFKIIIKRIFTSIKHVLENETILETVSSR